MRDIAEANRGIIESIEKEISVIVFVLSPLFSPNLSTP